jgi:capsular exopolysaccharide synthesis family protein
MEPQKSDSMQETKLHFLDYWRILRVRKTIIITVFLITFITTTVVTFILRPSYASTARIQIEPDIISDIQGVGAGDVTYTPYDPYFIQTAFEIIQDQVVLGKVIENLNLNVEWGRKYNGGVPLETSITMERLKRRMSLNAVRNTKLIEITVRDEDSDLAARIANATTEAYRDYRINRLKEQSLRGIKALEGQYQADEQQLDVVEQKVDQLRKELRIHDYDPNSTSPTPTLTSEQLHNYNNLMIEGEARYMKFEKQLTELQPLSPEKLREVLPTIVPDTATALSGLLEKLHEAQQKFVTLTNDYSPANPDVTRVQSLIDELNHQIDDTVSGIMASLATQVKSEKAALDGLTEAVGEAKQKDQEEATIGQPYWEEKRKLENMLEFHKLLASKIEAEKLDLEIPRTAMVGVIRQAEPARDPVSPNKALNITLGIVVGLVIGIALAFFIEYLDTSVKTIDEIERTFQAPVLGVIPQNVGCLVDEGPESQHAEAYRVLRTHLLFSRKDDKLNAIVTISAGMGEGKSITTLNLATVFAQAGQRVLVVDSDLRRPTLHKWLRVSNNIGLTNYLLKQNALEEVIQTTSVTMLDFMASGKLPSSSMSILNSPQMKGLIAELKRRYDFVFFDSPPILGVSDAAILASEVDMAIQVIQYRRYPQQMNMRAKQLVEKAGGNLIGIVLNNISMSQDEGYYYYYSRNEDEQETPAQNVPGESNRAGIKQKY